MGDDYWIDEAFVKLTKALTDPYCESTNHDREAEQKEGGYENDGASSANLAKVSEGTARDFREAGEKSTDSKTGNQGSEQQDVTKGINRSVLPFIGSIIDSELALSAINRFGESLAEFRSWYVSNEEAAQIIRSRLFETLLALDKELSETITLIASWSDREERLPLKKD